VNPEPCPATISLVTSTGDFFPGTYRGGDDDVLFGDDFAEQLAFACGKTLRLAAVA